MKRWFSLLAVLALVAAACGGGSDDGASATTQPAPATTQPAPTTTQPAPTTTQPAPTTTQATTTTQPAATGSTADLAITEIVFGDHLTITNLGDAPVDVGGLWVCNRPAYVRLTAEVLGPGESMQVAASKISVPEDGGEVALYSSMAFDDPKAILDYVGWGSGGGRASEAADAGHWPADETVTVSGPSISAPAGGASAADWS